MIGYEDEFTDLVAVLALGALPETEARRVAAHLDACDRCRSSYGELRPVADAVGFSAENTLLDEVTSARMKARLMRAVRAESSAVPLRSLQPQPARPQARVAWLAAAAAAIVAVGIGADNLSLRNNAAQTADRAYAQLAAGRSELAASQRDERSLRSSLASIVAPGSKHFAVPQGEIVMSASHVFVAVRLAPLPSGKVYQAWTLAKGAKAVAPSVTFSPVQDGVAVVRLPVDATGLAAVAVSVEPAGGSKAPTSTPTFIRKLS